MNVQQMTQSWSMPSLLAALSGLVKQVRGKSGSGLGPIVTDSRRIESGCIFLALKGERFDGHDYALKAAEQGARVLVLEHSVGANCPEIIVTDTAQAYGALARAWRSQFAIPLICVVGANGKTTTTQMIASILRSACGAEAMIATEGNFNNAVGVPKTLLRLNIATKAAVVEAGMNHPGEMAELVNWIRPTVVLVTNAQREHQEFLNGVEASARENGLAIVALSAKGTAVLPAADACLPVWQSLATARGCRVSTYSNGDAPADVTAITHDGLLTVQSQSETIETVLRMAGRHAVHDAAGAAAAAAAIGVGAEAIKQGLANFTPVIGRGVRHVLRNEAVLIDDAYNANPDSMRAAIDVLSQMPGPRILVVGDMAETGLNKLQYHREIGAYAKHCGIERMLAIGPDMLEAVREFGSGARHFQSMEELTTATLDALRTPGSVLVKASHSVGLTQVVTTVLAVLGSPVK